MTEERFEERFPTVARILDELAVPPASTLEELAARLRECEAEPDPLRRKLRVLDEIQHALQGASPTFMQIVSGIMDAARKTNIGPNAKTSAEVIPLAEAAAAVTFLVSYKNVPASTAHAFVARTAGVDEKKLKSFRQDIQRGRQAPDVLISYEIRLSALRIATSLPPR